MLIKRPTIVLIMKSFLLKKREKKMLNDNYNDKMNDKFSLEFSGNKANGTVTHVNSSLWTDNSNHVCA